MANVDWPFISYCLSLVVLIMISGMMSASEVAFFSLSPSTVRSLEEDTDDTSQKIIRLKNKPQLLLATMLISNNLVNVAIIIVSQMVLNSVLDQSSLNAAGAWLDKYLFFGLFSAEQLAIGFNFFITTILVTFILLLFGEVGPKLFANLNNIRVARFMAAPLGFLNFLFKPISSILVGWGDRIEDKISQNRNYQTGTSKEDLDHAIALTVNSDEDTTNQDADLLRGIVNFGDMSARQVMKPRVDIVAVEKETNFIDLLKVVNDSGYSRLPIYDDDIDRIIGILYVKDLIGYTQEPSSYDWMQLVRSNILYIPETKKIDDLLRDFQIKRMHMAIVVDEFGGTLGIVTLEDIMEEVIGEINDETDGVDDIDYVKLGEGNFIFEGKTLLNDVCRVMGEKTSYFDDIKGQGDSIGGLLIELLGYIPKPDKEIAVKEMKLKIVASNQRRVEKVNIKINSKV